MKLRHILLLSYLIAVFGIVFFLLKERTIEKPKLAKEKPIEKPKLAKEEPLKITIQPEGLLKEFPKEITFCFNIPYKEAAGFKKDDISDCIRIAPKVKASLEWINDVTLKVSFLEGLIPETQYKIAISNIPAPTPKPIPPKKFSFTT